MARDGSRAKLIQIWVAAVALVTVAGLALGAHVNVGTAAALVALCLVPPAILVLLWPDGELATIADVLHDVDRRA